MTYKPDYRIYIDDINYVNKIGNYNSVNFDIRSIGFENNSPIFRETNSYYNYQLPLPSNKLLSIDEYKLKIKKKIDSDIANLNDLLLALEKEPVYESQINPPEDRIPINVEAKLGREYFELNKFKAPLSDYEVVKVFYPPYSSNKELLKFIDSIGFDGNIFESQEFGDYYIQKKSDVDKIVIWKK